MQSPTQFPSYVYLLRSLKTGRYYIGQTNNLARRIRQHQNGKHPATRNRGPWELLYRIPCPSRSDAVKLEQKLKRRKRPDRVLNFV